MSTLVPFGLMGLPPRTPDPLQVRLLRLLRDEGPLSRAELGDRLETARTRLLAEIDRLAVAQLLVEAGPAVSRGGRPSTLVELNPSLRFAGVDLGATSIDVEVVDARMEPVAAFSEASDIRVGPKAILARVNELLRKTDQRLDAIGIGVPGPVSFRDGVPVSPPIMPGWDRFPVRELLSREHGCPAVVDNDVNIMAIGERHSGVAHTVDDFLFVKIGTGIGCGIHLAGEVYRGNDGCAGDIGHIQVDPAGPVCSCGNAGCLEALFGGAALAARGLDALEVSRAASEGDVESIQIIREGGRQVGAVLASLVSFANPSMIVIGGGLAQLGHVLLAEIRSVVYRRSLPLATGNLPIVLSELGPRAGVAGAAVVASELTFAQVL